MLQNSCEVFYMFVCIFVFISALNPFQSSESTSHWIVFNSLFSATSNSELLYEPRRRWYGPWEPYRAAQRKACQLTGATYLDTFGAGLGEKNNVHPTNKIPFVEMAAAAAAAQLDK